MEKYNPKSYDKSTSDIDGYHGYLITIFLFTCWYISSFYLSFNVWYMASQQYTQIEYINIYCLFKNWINYSVYYFYHSVFVLFFFTMLQISRIAWGRRMFRTFQTKPLLNLFPWNPLKGSLTTQSWYDDSLLSSNCLLILIFLIFLKLTSGSRQFERKWNCEILRNFNVGYVWTMRPQVSKII